MDFTPHETSGEKEALSKPKNQICKAPKEKHDLFVPLESGGVLLEPRFKKRKCLQSRTRCLRVGKRIHELHPPFSPCRAPLVFLSFSSPPTKKNRIFFFLIHRKLWLGCFNPAHLGVLGASGLSSRAPGGSGPPRGLPRRWRGRRGRRCCGGGGCARRG